MKQFVLFTLLCLPNFGHCQESINNLLDWEAPQGIKEKYPYYISGYTDEGIPIWIVEVGKWDFRGAAEKGGEYEELFKRHMRQILIRWKNSSLTISGKDSKDQTGFIAITDSEGLNIHHMGHVGTVKFMLHFVRDMVEILRDVQFKFVGVNVNAVAFGIWQIVQPILGSLANSFEIYGTNPQVWRPKLLRMVSKDQIPEYYGGSKDHKIVQLFG